MNLQFISDNKGKPTGVIIPFDEWEGILKKLAFPANDLKEPTKKQILDGIKDSLKEVKMIEAGILKPKSFDELLDEL